MWITDQPLYGEWSNKFEGLNRLRLIPTIEGHQFEMEPIRTR